MSKYRRRTGRYHPKKYKKMYKRYKSRSRSRSKPRINKSIKKKRIINNALLIRDLDTF